MTSFTHNDAEFRVEPTGRGWTIFRERPGGASAPIATGLFAGSSEAEAQARARALVKALDPVGIRLVGPDLTRTLRSGDLKIVGPDVAHPNFVAWEKDSASFPES